MFLKQNWKFLALVSVMVVLVYGNTLDNDLLSDDLAAIIQNPLIGTFRDVLTNPMYGMRTFVYNVIYSIWNVNPYPYHLINLLVHIIMVCLIFEFVRKISTERIALITALIFSVHPLFTESVTWVSGGIYAQYSVLVMISLLLYMKSKGVSDRLNLLGLLIFFLALATIEKAAAFPLLLVLYEFSFGNIRANWRKITPYFALSGIWTGLLLYLRLHDRLQEVAQNAGSVHAYNNPLQQIPIALFGYLKLFLWPSDLTFYHAEIRYDFREYLLMVSVLLVILAICVITYRSSKLLLFGFLFFFLSLTPTLTPIPIAWVVAERYVYLGGLGLCLMVAGSIDLLEKALRISNQRLVYVLLALLLIILGWRSVIRNREWQSQDTLWPATVKVSPLSPNAWNNMGDVYARHNELEKSVQAFIRATELLPTYADAYHNTANIYVKLGDNVNAEIYYKKAIELRPGIWQSRMNLAILLFNQKRYEEAFEQMDKAIQTVPNEPMLHVNLALMYITVGDRNKALAEINRALSLDPGNLKTQDIARTIQNMPEKENSK